MLEANGDTIEEELYIGRLIASFTVLRYVKVPLAQPWPEPWPFLIYDLQTSGQGS